jgi:hypothetical protein
MCSSGNYFLSVRELTPRLRFFSVAREKRRDEEAAMWGIELKSRFSWGVLLMGCICLTAMTLAAQQSGIVPGAAAAASAVPNLIKYSGVLKDASGAVLTTLNGVTFLIYKDEQGGTALWMETQNVQPDKTGHYTVQLGAVSKDGLPPDVFMTGEARWLAVQIGNEAEQPRVTLVAVPYAMKAADAQTIGGLPPSAFVLAAPSVGNAAASSAPSGSSTSTTAPPPASSNVTTTGGTGGTISMFTTATNIQNSIITQTGTTAINVGGTLNLPATGTATAIKGFNSQAQRYVASVFNSTTSTAVPQTFQWQAEPVNNDKSTATGTLDLLYATGTATPAETGLKINNKGVFTFAASQTFPGTGTVTSVTAGAGLAGGTITKTGTISIPNGGVSDTMLAHSSFTINPGTDLTGGGLVSLGGATTLSIDTTKVPQLAANNSFTGATDAFAGNVTATNFAATGAVSGTTASFATSSSSTTPGLFSNTGGGPILSALTSGSSQLVQISGNDPSGAALLVNATVATNQLQGILAFGGNSGTSAAASPAFNGGGGNNTSNGAGGPGVVGVGGISNFGTGGAGGSFTGDAGSPDGDGVDATNVDGGTFGSSLAYAGNFAGDINVTGSVFAVGKDFKIDHPLDPANKYLFHASVESSEMMNIYTGNAVLDANGQARIELPDWFDVLNRDFRYQLTAIGKPGPGLYVADKISGSHFTIAGGAPGAEVSWQVTGVRQDPYAKAHPLVVEQEKEARLRGFYIHPELYSAPEEKQIEWARNPEWMRTIKEMRAKQHSSPRPAGRPTSGAAHQTLRPVASPAGQR